MRRDKIKGIIALLLVGTMAISIFGCGDKTEEPLDQTSDKETVSQEPTEDTKAEEEADKETDKKTESETESVSTDKDKTEPVKDEPKKEESTANKKPAAVKEKSLSTIISKIYDGIEDLPKLGNTTLTSDNFNAFAFIDKGEGMKGIASEALIGSIAHSVVVIRVPSGESAKEVAARVKANADPRKWICVEAEKTIVKYHKQTVILIMSTKDAAEAIADNFDALY